MNKFKQSGTQEKAEQAFAELTSLPPGSRAYECARDIWDYVLRLLDVGVCDYCNDLATQDSYQHSGAVFRACDKHKERLP